MGNSQTTLTPEIRTAVINHILRYELYRHRRLVQRIASRAETRFLSDVKSNTNTWEVVFFICRCWLEGTVPTASDIFLATGLSKGTATTCINRLDRAGIIYRTPGVEDRRQRFVRLTDDYADLLERFVLDSHDEFQILIAPRPEKSGLPNSVLMTHLSHDLRGQLNTIIGFSEAIKDEMLGRLRPSGYIEYANDIHRAASELSDLVNDVIDLSQFETSGIIPIQPAPINLADTIESCRSQIQPEADRKNVMLQTEIVERLPAVKADESRIKRAVSSLIHNAVKFSPVGGIVEVVVQAGRHDIGIQSIDIIVIDSGPGVSESVLAADTAPLNRLQATDDIYEMGTGLGLAIAQTIAEAHQGRLGVENRPAGGTRVWITLPALSD